MFSPHRFFAVIGLFCSLFIQAETPFTVTHTVSPDNQITINLAYTLEPLDAIFKNSIRFSIDTPDLEIVEWKSGTPAKTVYDASHTSDTLGYTDSGTLSVIVQSTTQKLPDDAILFMHYQRKQGDHPQQFAHPITLNSSSTQEPGVAVPAHATQQNVEPQPQNKGVITTFIEWLRAQLIYLKNVVENLVERTSSTPLRLMFVFLLGILMSLTPCIYPMIPITMGILQTTAGTSLLRNFLLASCYTLGIATTFATLGLLAAAGSAQFGALMGNVYFILFLVIFLLYLAFSMLGFYDMYVPRFMQGNNDHAVNGSYVSAFIFGVVSGSIASPCLSPGLALLLGIVATMGNMVLGFIYLFFFGLGLGTPLLIIGTFSNSINIAPKAGLWMIEVKKLFGLMLICMCFYYLSAVLPWHMLLVLAGATFVGIGLWYITTIEKYYSFGMRWYKQIFGVLLIVIGLIAWYQALKVIMSVQEPLPELHHNTNYALARTQAQTEKKLLLVDFGASWCSSCNEIEHKFLQNSAVVTALESAFVIVKIDCTNSQAESCAQVQKQFNIVGFPTMLVVEPAEQKVLARWGGELLDLTTGQFVELVTKAR